MMMLLLLFNEDGVNVDDCGEYWLLCVAATTTTAATSEKYNIIYLTNQLFEQNTKACFLLRT